VNVARDLPQVLIVPGRLDALEQPWFGRVVIPADPEPVAVGGFGAELRVQALVDQRVGR